MGVSDLGGHLYTTCTSGCPQYVQTPPHIYMPPCALKFTFPLIMSHAHHLSIEMEYKKPTKMPECTPLTLTLAIQTIY